MNKRTKESNRKLSELKTWIKEGNNQPISPSVLIAWIDILMRKK